MRTESGQSARTKRNRSSTLPSKIERTHLYRVEMSNGDTHELEMNLENDSVLNFEGFIIAADIYGDTYSFNTKYVVMYQTIECNKEKK